MEPTKSQKLTIPELMRASPRPISENTIRRGIKEGRLPAERFLNRFLIDPEDFEAFCRGKRVSR